MKVGFTVKDSEEGPIPGWPRGAVSLGKVIHWQTGRHRSKESFLTFLGWRWLWTWRWPTPREMLVQPTKLCKWHHNPGSHNVTLTSATTSDLREKFQSPSFQCSGFRETTALNFGPSTEYLRQGFRPVSIVVSITYINGSWNSDKTTSFVLHSTLRRATYWRLLQANRT